MPLRVSTFSNVPSPDAPLDGEPVLRVLVVDFYPRAYTTMCNLLVACQRGRPMQVDWAPRKSDAVTALSDGEHDVCLLGNVEQGAWPEVLDALQACAVSRRPPVVLIGHEPGTAIHTRALSLGPAECITATALDASTLSQALDRCLLRPPAQALKGEPDEGAAHSR